MEARQIAPGTSLPPAARGRLPTLPGPRPTAGRWRADPAGRTWDRRIRETLPAGRTSITTVVEVPTNDYDFVCAYAALNQKNGRRGLSRENDDDQHEEENALIGENDRFTSNLVSLDHVATETTDDEEVPEVLERAAVRPDGPLRPAAPAERAGVVAPPAFEEAA
jgi:hypothetical protein